MATPRVRSSYIPVYEHDPAQTSNTSTDVELQSLHDKKTPDEVRRNTKFIHPTFQPASFPLQGPVALLAIVLLTGAAGGVLLASRGSPTERWGVQNLQIQPQVWLSVLSTIMDGLTMFAFAKAAQMMYWRAATRGTTLREMYDLYESQSILGALKNLFHLRGDGLAVVSVLCLVSALRGPLFQRASTVDGATLQHVVGKQELEVAQLIPPNFFFQGISNPVLFDRVSNDYLERAPILKNITYDEKECGDSCEGKVKGYGFDIQCSDVFSIPWDNSSDSALLQIYQSPNNEFVGAVPAFNSSAVLLGATQESTLETQLDDTARDAQTARDQQGWFQITNLFKPESVCGGNLSIHKCSLHHAVVEYNVVLSNGTLSLGSQSWQDDNVLFQTPTWSFPTTFAPIQNSEDPWGPTFHWVQWLTSEFNEEIDTSIDDDKGLWDGANTRGYSLAKRFIHGDITNISCSTTFGDPTQFVLDRLREVAFRTAVVTATVADPVILFGSAELAQEGLSRAQNWTQTIDLIGQRRSATYTVSIRFLACAIACSLLAVVAIVPLYWKARSEILVLRSFNPLDVAHVFDAPLLQNFHEKDMETYVRKEQGLRRVRCLSKESDNGDDAGAMRILPENRDIAAVAE